MIEKDFVIIGAGQCGLAAGRLLQKKNQDFVILEQQKDVGDGWRAHYDSLRLFTPAEYSSLPDLPMALSPTSRPTKDQIADYLNRYALHFDLPIHTKNKALHVRQIGNRFLISTVFEEISARNIILANGFCQKPNFPKWHSNLSCPYLHSKNYKNPISIKGKKVLVVGAGNSAAQIVAELTPFFQVHWSVNKKPRMVPLYVFGKNVIWWADKFNKLDKKTDEKTTPSDDRIFYYDDLKKKVKKATRQPKVTQAQENKITFENGKTETFDFVLFATGYQPDFSFLEIEGFEYDIHRLREQQGISKVNGLYVIGIPFQRTRSSHLIHGAQKDAQFIVEQALSRIG